MEDKVKCSKGHENPVGSNFCATCREKIAGGLVHCPNCGVTNDSGANFCKQCGKSMDTVPDNKPSAIEGMKWKRGVDDFATRIDVEDLQGILKKGLVVEQGTKALLFTDGALTETLLPGRYDLGGLWDKFKSRTATAILIDSGDVELNQDVIDIYTNDPLSIDVTCNMISQIEDATLFFNNVMKGRNNYLISELRSSLNDELQNAFNEVIGKKSVTDLNWDLSLKHQFEASVENHLKTTFQRDGLTFIQLRTIDYRFKGYNKVREIYEEVYLQVSEDEAKLQGRKRLFDVFDKGQLQDIFEETRRLDREAQRETVQLDHEAKTTEKRIEVWQRLRQIAKSDEMNVIKSDDDFEAYMQEIFKGKELRKDEIADLTSFYAKNRKSREFLLQKIDLEYGLECDRLKIEIEIEKNRAKKIGNAEVELEHFEVEAKRKRREAEVELEHFEIEAKRKRRVLEENLKIKSAEREVEVEEAKTDSTVKDIERETRDKDRKTDREEDEKDMELGLKSLKAVKEVKMRERRDEMDIEAERLERLSKVGIEALITASNSDQAKILGDLKKTEILKGMSEEQILAMGAKDSEHLAMAFQEKFRGLSAEKQETLYKEMIADKDKSTKIMQEMFNKALDTQRDVSVAAAQSGHPNVVYPPQGHSPIYTTPVTHSGITYIICPKCDTKGSKGEKFCNNCGNEIS